MIPLFKVFCAEDVCEHLKPVFDSGYIGQGEKVEEFEEVLKERFQTDYVATVNNGTAALHLALHLIKTKFDLDSDTEVLTTSLTCTATNWPILANGLRIKWADIDSQTLNVDIDDVARKLTPKVGAVMVVHWGGYPVDLYRLRKVVQEAAMMYGHQIPVVEDCAHAFGARYRWAPIGSHGNYCAFSFQAIKHLTCVDGGALTVGSAEQYKRAKLLRWYGIDRECNSKDFRCEADIPEWGFKFHMNDINATVGLANLRHVDELVLEKQKENAAFYDKELEDVDGVTLMTRHEGHESSFWIYSMLVERRDDFYRAMKSAGIMVSQVHERNNKHSCVSEFRAQLPTLERVLPRLVSIPVGWWVSAEDREYIVSKIKEGW
jgi:dTDP-4-amino-4,6-dideoxygalactose transaminase